jgi:hypothetical protein
MNELKHYFLMWSLPLLLLVIMVAGCEDRAGLITSPTLTTPTVSATNPVNASTGMPFNQKISATFSELMDSTTITTASFTLMQGTTFVAGTVSYTGTTATFAPSSNLAANTLYTATITTTAKSLMAEGLSSNYVWSFTTGAAAAITPPSVVLTDPLNAASSVPINQKIAATFSVAMDAATITASTFTLLKGTSPVSGFVSYTGTTALFTPASNLSSNTAYTVTITTGAKDLASNALASDYVWSFTTGSAAVVTPPIVSSTDPANLATSVPLNQKIAATFSKTLDASTMTTAVFTLKNTSTSVAVSGFVSYSGSTAIFAPAANLSATTSYTATITTGAKDLAGNALAADYVWTFTTGAAAVITPPAVSLTDPANVATNVALNQKVAATFSKTLDASTMTTATFTLKQGTTAIAGFVSYSGTTAIFAPTSNLLPNSIYTATITTGAKDLAGNALASDYVWSFTTGAAVVVTPPTVISTDPVDLATGIALNQKISATFSKTMDAATITTAIFTLKQGTTSISGFVSYSGTTAIFAPASSLSPNTIYTATIATGAKDLAGNALAANFVWTFTTGAAVVVTPPTVLSTDPLNLATGVTLNQKIAATFSKSMDASTITTASFTLMQGTTFVSGTVSYVGTTATYVPSSNLVASTLYTATITTAAKDLAGNSLALNYVWTFTTGATVIIIPPTVTLTDPLDLATGVALDKKITATFSKTMDASTITAATFTLKQGTTSISGLVSYSGSVATFTPSSTLTSNTLYTATIATGAKDLAGNALANDYVWSFTTAVVNPPTVTLTDPLNLATSVALDKKITATFSKTMDASTITTSTFIVMKGTTAVPGFVSYSGTTASFTPSSSLVSNTLYTVTVSTGVKDVAGNALVSDYVWSFTTLVIVPPTVTLTDPLDLATNVALDKKITATFSKTMDASSITTTTFTVMQGTSAVSGFVSYSGTTATFTPASSLASNAVYTVTITTGAKDLAGTSLVSNYVWSFTTALSAGGLPVALGTSARFAILSNSAITDIPTSAITGDVGISPGARSSITGLTIPEVTGTIYAADDATPVPAMLIAAKNDAASAYLDATAAGRGTPTSLSGNINGLTLVSGLYESGTSIEISPGGIVYLDAQGDVNAVFVIRSATSITTSATSQVVLTNGANAKNIFWSAGSAITLGTNSKMKGTLIASTSISLLTGARLDGRALIQGAAAGQVSLDQNIIVLP